MTIISDSFVPLHFNLDLKFFDPVLLILLQESAILKCLKKKCHFGSKIFNISSLITALVHLYHTLNSNFQMTCPCVDALKLFIRQTSDRARRALRMFTYHYPNRIGGQFTSRILHI